MDPNSREYETCLCRHVTRGEIEDFIRESGLTDLKEICEKSSTSATNAAPAVSRFRKSSTASGVSGNSASRAPARSPYYAKLAGGTPAILHI